jgi:uncharacterized protein (DUF1499 family)
MYATAINATTEQSRALASRWALRLAVFSMAVIIAGVLCHRLLAMPTPVALNLFKIGFAGAALALLLVLAAIVDIWRNDSRGVLPITIATVLSSAIFAWPAAYVGHMRGLPLINDVSTDLSSPPTFVALSPLRRGSANPAAHPGATAAQLQSDAYPDIRSLVVERAVDEVFELAHHVVVRVFKMSLVAEDAPGARPGAPGRIEAVDRTPVLGFYDDVTIRLIGDARRSRIDVRSASRYGQHDLGRNASRIRRFLREMQAQLDATVPSSAGERMARLRDRLGKRLAVPKRALAADPQPAGQNSPRDPAKSDARRGPEQKVRPRAKDGGPTPDTRPAQSPR